MVRKTEPKYIKNILLYEWINLGEPLVILYYPHRSNLIIVPTHCQEFSLEASMYSRHCQEFSLVVSILHTVKNFTGSIYVFYTLSRNFPGSIYSTHCQEFSWKYLFYLLSRIFLVVSTHTVENFPWYYLHTYKIYPW